MSGSTARTGKPVRSWLKHWFAWTIATVLGLWLIGGTAWHIFIDGAKADETTLAQILVCGVGWMLIWQVTIHKGH